MEAYHMGKAKANWLRLAPALLAAFLVAGPARGGELVPPAGPTAAGGAMYTLLDIWNRLNTNTLATKATFSGPTVGAIAGSMKTLDDIYGIALPTQAPKTRQADGVPYAAQTGSDGLLQMGVSWPNPRFTINKNASEVEDGTVTDNLTGLVWLREPNCLGALTWEAALTGCHGLAAGSCGLADGSVAGDWRLPNRRELASLIDYRFYNPSLCSTDGSVKYSISGVPFVLSAPFQYYWTSATYPLDTSYAWTVDMAYGLVVQDVKTNPRYVWPVRNAK